MSPPSGDVHDRTLAVFDALDDPAEPLSSTEVADRLDRPRRTVYKRLELLADRGDLRTKKVGARGRVWWRPVAARAGSSDRPADEPSSEPTDGRRGGRPTTLEAGGEMGRRIDEHDWSATPLGPMEDWPVELGVAVDLMLGADEAIGLYWGSELTVLYNDAARDLIGTKHPEALGRPGREVFPEAWETLGPLHEQVMAGGGAAGLHEHLLPLDRAGELEEGWFTSTYNPIPLADGSVGGVCNVAVEVTDRVRAHEALRESEERLRLALEATDTVAWEYDLETGDIVYRSAGTDRLFGYPEPLDDWTLQRFLDHVHPDDLAAVEAVVTREPEPGELAFTCRVVRADDAVRWVRVVGEVYGDATGEPARVVGVVRDVTDRKARERELERYASIIDAVGAAAYELDVAGRFRFVNGPLEEQSGYSEAELLGRHVSLGMDDAAVEQVEEELLAHLRDGGEGTVSVEYEAIAKDGTRLPVENRFTLLTGDDGRLRGTAGVLWDRTARLERERRLEESERRYRALAEHVPNGAIGLFDERLEFTLVAGQQLAVHDLTADDLEGAPVGTPFADPSTKARVRERCRAVLDGETGRFEFALEGHTYEAWAVPVTDDDGSPFAGLVMAMDVTEQRARERMLTRQRQQLAALADWNAIVADVTEALIEQSTREAVEEAVCEALAASDSYAFAWLAEVDPRTEAVVPRAEAGVEGYLDEVPLTADPDVHAGRGPVGRAIRTLELQVSRVDEHVPSLRAHAEAYGFRAVAAIPIAHEGTLFGVLAVYADRPDAFDGEERAVLGRLGPLVGHAIAAAERRRALLGDDLVELEFHVPDLVHDAPGGPGFHQAVTVERVVPVGDGGYLAYGTASSGAMARLEAAVSGGDVPGIEAVTVLVDDGETGRFEVSVAGSPVLDALATHGGSVAEARLEAGDAYLRLHLASEAGVRAVIEGVRESFPRARLVTRHQRRRPARSSAALGQLLAERLTDRQQAVLEAAYFAGFFEWPRTLSGEAVADSIGISASTFHQHLRKAEKGLLDVVFDGA